MYGYAVRANLIVEALEENAAFHVVCKTELTSGNLISFDYYIIVLYIVQIEEVETKRLTAQKIPKPNSTQEK